MREVFVARHLKNINLFHFWKNHLGLVTIVSAKQWLKHDISAKNFLLVMFSSFHFFCSFNYFNFTLDKLHCWWKYFHLFLPFTASVFTFTVYLWLLCNFALTFTLTFTWYTLTTDTLWLLCFQCHCEFWFRFYHSLWKIYHFDLSLTWFYFFFVYKLFVEWSFWFIIWEFGANNFVN